MASRMRNVMEPVLGWLFIIVLVVVVGAVMVTASRPRFEVSGHTKTQLLPH